MIVSAKDKAFQQLGQVQQLEVASATLLHMRGSI